jgi:chromosome partitioning protein
MTTTVALMNQKGGVGKTSVTLGLAGAAQKAGLRTLVADLDPQANATWGLDVEVDAHAARLLDVLWSNEVGAAADLLHPSGWGEQVDCLPATSEMVQFEARPLRVDPEDRLRRALTGTFEQYDLILLDCPPSLGRITTNALVAADRVLVVAEPSALSLLGVEAVDRLIGAVAPHHDSGVTLDGIIVNKMPARGREAERQLDALGALAGRRQVWRPAVPLRAVMTEAMADRTPIQWWGYRARDLVEVFDSLLRRLRRTSGPAQ